MKQYDIFGNEVDVETIVYPPPRCGKTYKQKFRNEHGFKNGYFCKNCKYFVECEKLGITCSSATDIRKSDVACNLYEEEKENGQE